MSSFGRCLIILDLALNTSPLKILSPHLQSCTVITACLVVIAQIIVISNNNLPFLDAIVQQSIG